MSKPNPTPTWDADLLAAQQQALDDAVAEGRISPEVRAIAGQLLDGLITDAEAQEKYAALATSVLP